MNIKQELLCYVQRNFASFGLLCFAKYWSYTFKVWWDISQRFCCKLHGEQESEKNENRSKFVSKLWTNVQ